MMRDIVRALILPAVLVCSFPAVCLAQEAGQEGLAPLQAGPVIINPSLSLQEAYTDNVFAVAEDAQGDFATSIKPGLLLRLPFRMHEIALGASAEIRKYAEFSSEDISPWQAFGRGDFAIGDRFRIRVEDTFEENYETALESTTGAVEKNDVNAATISAKYAFVDVAQARLDYTRTTLRFDDVEDYRSRDEDLVSAYLYYRVLPNTSAFLQYDFRTVAYTEDEGKDLDNDVNRGSLGATWEITANSKGTAKVGFESKNFKDDTQDDYSTWTASVDLNHELNELTSVRLIGARVVNEGKYRDTRYYTTTGVTAELTYRFLDRLAGLLNAGYALDEFSDINPGDEVIREDKTFRVGVGARYFFNSWLECSLHYRYLNRDSNIASYSMEENVVALEVTARR